MDLEVDFVDFELALDDRPIRLEPLGVLHFLDLIGAHIDRDVEALVLAGREPRYTEQERDKKCGNFRAHNETGA